MSVIPDPSAGADSIRDPASQSHNESRPAPRWPCVRGRLTAGSLLCSDRCLRRRGAAGVTQLVVAPLVFGVAAAQVFLFLLLRLQAVLEALLVGRRAGELVLQRLRG